MNVRNRVLACRMLEHAARRPELCSRLGMEARVRFKGMAVDIKTCADDSRDKSVNNRDL